MRTSPADKRKIKNRSFFNLDKKTTYKVCTEMKCGYDQLHLKHMIVY